MPLIAVVIVLGVIAGAIGILIQYWQITIPVGLVIAAIVVGPRIVRHFRKKRYFRGSDFLNHKRDVQSVVAEHNEVVAYLGEMRDRGVLDIGRSETGQHAYMASFENTSSFKYRRDRNVANYAATNVHNCSLQVVRNASANPLEYVIKYFGISKTDEGLSEVEMLGERVEQMEKAVSNLQLRESRIVKQISPPSFITQYYHEEFLSEVGVELPQLKIPYPQYVFEYVSAGGNSSQRSAVELTTQNVDSLVQLLSQKIRFRKSVAGQRALMTSGLREYVKSRDAFTCKSCGASTASEPNLLLEIDHIHPLSRGGMTTLDNLQTLCWRCNRRKSNKVLSG